MPTQEPINGQTFNWAGMWGFGAGMIVVITLIFMLMFKESDGDIKEIDVPQDNGKPATA
ncbi:hypothetical protein [Budvicia aquatica]|uniref:Nucleoside transporter yegT n=1 Tax=Budvicia aquatica TaxID=82979 RepID=A0A484ZPI3_9GAMM|nr:Putative nucleoside transporter yegT [Budvicia aquatica]